MAGPLRLTGAGPSKPPKPLPRVKVEKPLKPVTKVLPKKTAETTAVPAPMQQETEALVDSALSAIKTGGRGRTAWSYVDTQSPLRKIYDFQSWSVAEEDLIPSSLNWRITSSESNGETATITVQERYQRFQSDDMDSDAKVNESRAETFLLRARGGKWKITSSTHIFRLPK